MIEGNASQSAGATGHGGLLVVHGDAAARCGISMKGIDIVVRGSVGHLSGFMAQTGRLVVCGDAGEALGDSIYEARLYVRGAVAGLGADCVEKELRDEHRAELAELLAQAGVRRRRPQPVPPLRLGAAALQLQGRQRGRRTDAATRPGTCASRTSTTSRSSPRSSARRARASTTSAASAPSGGCRTSTTCSCSARASPATRSRATASGATRRHARDALREEAARAEDPDHDRRHELRRLSAPAKEALGAAPPRWGRRRRPATAA